MEWMKRFEPLWLGLVVIAGLNWACVALFDTNVLAEVLGTGTALDVAYVVLGFAALMLVPMLAARLHVDHRLHRPGAHPA